MANEFVQRQITGFIAPGTGDNPNQFDPSTCLWQIQDVYPSTIMKLDPGKYTSGIAITSSGGSSITIPLPGNYDSANKLAVFLAADVDVKVTNVSPAHSTGTAMLIAGTPALGLLSFVERVTSITITNNTAIDGTIAYATWEYPADLTSPDAWQSGNETIGTVST